MEDYHIVIKVLTGSENFTMQLTITAKDRAEAKRIAREQVQALLDKNDIEASLIEVQSKPWPV